ncbi:VanZ family protein [Metabacillus sp. GX 13764]|uniref:VanZ family protein n=1 Tax=Metabacillus kandeliae TaxID=2900151 RepID=UPI001E3B554A|nr:VanZ family protein [Metabacillus kandeliae]MCD7035114.1 VanZ family protein [Metabacillus kandeliae]
MIMKRFILFTPLLFLAFYYSLMKYNILYAIPDALTLLEMFLNLIPFIFLAVISYRKLKKISLFQTMVLSVFCMYLFCLWFYTLGYFPYREIFAGNMLSLEQQTSPQVNLTLLGTIRGSITPENIYGNILLLFPLAVFLVILSPRFRKFIPAMLVIICVTLCIESLQYFYSYIDGKYSDYPRNRAFDVDDLLLNTVGGSIGYLFSKYLCLLLIRSTSKMKTKNLRTSTHMKS